MTQEADVLRILLATDNHLGVWENDEVRRNDSFVTFEEIFELAAQNNADMVLLGGDLFHDNKPSRTTVVKAMDILSRHCLNDRPIAFQVLSDQTKNFTTGQVNFENPNHNIGLPVFTIHGNHDDPAGTDNLSAVDILATGGLVNYFGKAAITGEGAGKVSIAPVLLQKGNTKLALYGLGNIRDERLCRIFQTPNAVEWIRPASTRETRVDDWFNVFLLHQNRVQHTQGAKNCLREGHLARFLDLILWGHEHECKIDPVESIESGCRFSIIQPGSSVATALSEGESRKKHVALLEVMGQCWRSVKLPLETVRPFSFDSVVLKVQPGLDPEEPETIIEFLSKKVHAMIQEVGRNRGPRTPELPLIRLRVDYTDFSTINTQRFGQRFVGKVANPQDIILWQKAPVKRAKVDKEAMAAAAEALSGGNLEEVRIEDLITTHLIQNLELLPQYELTEALREFVDKGETNAINATVEAALKETQLIAEANMDERHANEEDDKVQVSKKEREKELFNAINLAAEKRKLEVEAAVKKRKELEAANQSANGVLDKSDEAGPSNLARAKPAAAKKKSPVKDAFDESEEEDEIAAPKPRAGRGRGRAKVSQAVSTAANPRKRRTVTQEEEEEVPVPRGRSSRTAAAAAKKKLAAQKEKIEDKSGDEDFDEDVVMEQSLDDEIMEEEVQEVSVGAGIAASRQNGARKPSRSALKGVGTDQEPISLIESDEEDEGPRGRGGATQRGGGRTQLMTQGGRMGGSGTAPSQQVSRWGTLK